MIGWHHHQCSPTTTNSLYPTPHHGNPGQQAALYTRSDTQQKSTHWLSTVAQRCRRMYTLCAVSTILFLIITTEICACLTLSTPAVRNCCCSKGLAPYWSNPPFFSFWHSGALALRTERQRAWMSKVKNGGLHQCHDDLADPLDLVCNKSSL